MADSATPSRRDLKFVGSDAAGLPLKRKQVQHACEPCRKKKKRCTHTEDGAVPHAGSGQHDLDAIAASQLLHFSSQERLEGPDQHTHESTPHRSDDEPPTFIGDLNPESILIHAVTTDADRSRPDLGVPGLWYRARQQSIPVKPTFGGNKSTDSVEDILERDEGRHEQLPRSPPVARTAQHMSAPLNAGTSETQGPNLTRSPIMSHLNGESQLDGSSPLNIGTGAGPGSFDEPCRCSPARPRVKDCHECLRTMIQKAQKYSAESFARDILPDAASWSELKSVYLTKLHPILPIFDASRLNAIEDPRKPGTRRIDQLIVASVSNAASFDATVYNRKASRKPTLHHTKMAELATEISGRIDKKRHLFDYLRAMTLLCFFWQADSPNPQGPLDAFAEVVLLVQTHGLHIWEIRDWVARGFDNPPDQKGFLTLFACILSVDRLNAAYYGRPVLFHEQDLASTKYLWGGRSRDPTERSGQAGSLDQQQGEEAPLEGDPAGTSSRRAESSQTTPTGSTSDEPPPAFRVYMSIIFYLDRVIELYRPNPSWHEVTPPVFEQLVLDAGAEDEPSSILATLEIFYHAVGILSVRMTHAGFQESPEAYHVTGKRGPQSKHLPSPNLNSRRSLSADRIYWIVRTHELSALSFIPYALTLSLSVAYRKWRFSKVAMFRSRGRATFTAITSSLEVWSRFHCAYRNIKLATAVIAKMNEVEDTARGVSSREASAITAPVREGEPIPATGDRVQSREDIRPNTGTVRTRPSSAIATGSEPVPLAGHPIQRGANTSSDRPPAPGSVISAAPSSSFQEIRTPSRVALQPPTPLEMGQESDVLGVPMSLLHSSSGFDVFHHVDKASFPQNTVDFAFYSNLDPTFPSNGWLDFDPRNVDMDLVWDPNNDAWVLKRW
ncbi:hypothetical protein GQ53DRAFT_816012 [Thozetella sp. PMI_491]|nr:hypothetical protein GQ53DRAFT_816012 [Thozetella sp. PMI_491]